MDWLQVQQLLDAHGFNPGPKDGIPGRLTRGAVKRFQIANGLKPDGIVGLKTRKALLSGRETSVQKETLPVPPWMAIAQEKKGLHERIDNEELRIFLKSDGPTLGDPSQLPWCGDFVETCIALSLPEEFIPGNPYLARNWLKFGTGLKDPVVGAVLVFWRGSRKGISGHVGFYAGEDAKHFHVLGGNQSNRVSVTRIKKNRLLGARWPKTGPTPAMGKLSLAAVGEVSTNEA